MLTDKIRLSGPDANEPEDILSSSLGVIFPDDITNQHGDRENAVIYLSPTFGSITLTLADPQGEDSRRLFSHFLWNAGLQLAEFIEEDSAQWSVKGERVLELGAGTGLAGIVAGLMGAETVVISDYPAPEVLANIGANIKRNVTSRAEKDRVVPDMRVQGHEWGAFNDEDGFCEKEREGFDKLLVADCLWMPWQHANLLSSIQWFLKGSGRAWVVAGFHTGRAKMKGFYDEALLKQMGLEIESIHEKNADGSERAWVEDRGIEDVTERKRWLVVAVLKRRG
ncbi:Elongation factor methyltransferase 7 [Hyphodiscus hymeniophilus]|uniref:Elongation factor methyltransferase 7 n=1 Tax=Hyphodiscus hymeniophilus TaxID=353542 RepID=A0A9P6VFH1_9HELO|nr:Elongation factor methyltransferase 7 [Hyphodiscus hymeniophilus]